MNRKLHIVKILISSFQLDLWAQCRLSLKKKNKNSENDLVDIEKWNPAFV